MHGEAPQSQLRGVVLGLLVGLGEPTHGYMLATLMRRHLGPAWQIEPKGVYQLLKGLLDEGLVEAADSGGGGDPDKKLYRPTDRSSGAMDDWMRARVSISARRGELEAKIAVSREQDIPLLERALDEYERDCLRLLRETEETKHPMVSWRAVAMNIAGEASDLHLRSELQWIERARGWIADWEERGPRPDGQAHR